MADPRANIHALMRGLVARYFPSQQSAAKEMADFWHPTGNAGDDYDTADLSRKMNGSRQWTVNDVIALQSIAGSTRVTDAMAEGRKAGKPQRDPLTALQHARALVHENGEGVEALMALHDGGSRADARAELVDIVETAQRAIDDLDHCDMLALRASDQKGLN